MAQELTTSRQWFTDTGTTICTWAASQGFPKELVYAVLSGRIKGVRGEAFHVRRKLLEITGEWAPTRYSNSEPSRAAKPANEGKVAA